MNFIVDAQLPKSLSLLLQGLGYGSQHTLDLPEMNETSDVTIYRLAYERDLTVITKDTDFLHSHLLLNKPKKLILVRTGNLKNHTLLHIFESNIKQIIEALETCNMIEILKDRIVFHS